MNTLSGRMLSVHSGGLGVQTWSGNQNRARFVHYLEAVMVWLTRRTFLALAASYEAHAQQGTLPLEL